MAGHENGLGSIGPVQNYQGGFLAYEFEKVVGLPSRCSPLAKFRITDQALQELQGAAFGRFFPKVKLLSATEIDEASGALRGNEGNILYDSANSILSGLGMDASKQIKEFENAQDALRESEPTFRSNNACFTS